MHPLRHTSSWCSSKLIKHRDNFIPPPPKQADEFALPLSQLFC
jgi:hypothetical protein